jgi:hypothetical protein
LTPVWRLEQNRNLPTAADLHLLEQPSIETLGRPYEVAVIDADEHKTEILALCRNVIVAKAAFVAAVEQRAGKRLKLTRGAQVHADSGDKQ